MQKRMLPLLLALLLCAGCQRFYPDEYLSVQEHEAPFAYRETVTVPAATETEPPVSIKRVSRAYDIREAIQDMVMSGEESGELLLTNYAGDVVNDMQNMFGALLSDSPKLNYAMDRFDWSLKHTERGTVVRIAMKLRLTPQEIQAIETRLFPNPALSDIYSALRSSSAPSPSRSAAMRIRISSPCWTTTSCTTRTRSRRLRAFSRPSTRTGAGCGSWSCTSSIRPTGRRSASTGRRQGPPST